MPSRSLLSIVGRALIIAFCVWHSAAITIFQLPDSRLVNILKPIIRPYVLISSQWQLWDIFSPDPLQRVSFFRVDMQQANGSFVPVVSFEPTNIPWHERAKELKVLGRLEADWKVLTPNYLNTLCQRIPDSEGKTLQLVAEYYVLPHTIPELRTFSKHPHPLTETIIGNGVCSTPARHA